MAKRSVPSTIARIGHMVEAIDKIGVYLDATTLAGFQADERTILAITKLYEIIGEAAYKIDKETKAANPDIEWTSMETMRHILVHNYYEVVAKFLWTTRQDELPALREKLISLQTKLERN